MNQKHTKRFHAFTFKNGISFGNRLIITRAILGITISLSAAPFTTGTKETPATKEAPATAEKTKKPHGYMIANYTSVFFNVIRCSGFFPQSN